MKSINARIGGKCVSKKVKMIELVEDEKVINGVTVSELKFGDRSLGTVQAEDNKFIANLPNGEKFNVQTHSEATNLLISYYHLHS